MFLIPYITSDTKTKIFDLPTASEVELTIEKAKQAAIEDAAFLGISPEFEEYAFQSRIDMQDIIDDDCSMEEDENEDSDPDDETAFTTIVDENGEEMIIRKSTLVWMLTEPSIAMSNDRLRRVQVTNTNR